MKWYVSPDGVLVLSVLALLSLLGRTFLDWRYVLPEYAMGRGMEALAMLGYVALFGGWIWALLAAVRGSRRAVAVALTLSLLFLVGGGIGTLLAFCPSPCQTAWPLVEIANWSNLLFGMLATLSAGPYLRQARRT